MRPRLKKLLESLGVRKADNAGADSYRGEPAAMASERHEVIVDVDPSPSMSPYLGPLFGGVKRFSSDIRRDPFLRQRVDITVWAFDDRTPAKRLVDAVPADRFEVPRVPTCSHSPVYGSMALAWEDAIERNEKLATLRDCDVASSWVFLFSDCGATDRDSARVEALSMQARAREAGVNTFVLTLGVVDDAVAKDLSDPGRPPIALESVEDFADFFAFLKRSLRQKSMSMPGQPLRLEFRDQSLEANG